MGGEERGRRCSMAEQGRALWEVVALLEVPSSCTQWWCWWWFSAVAKLLSPVLCPQLSPRAWTMP